MADVAEPFSTATNVAERQWQIVGRWQEVAGELRANLLRIIAIGVFYGIELLANSGLAPAWLQLSPAVDQRVHVVITAVAVAWILVAVAVQLMLREHLFSPAIKYLTTGCDLVLLTTIAMVAHGPRSAVVYGYFLIVALAGLRFQLRLVWFATLGAMLAYLVLLGYARWWVPDALRSEMTVPRYQQLLFLASLALLGAMVGQIVRRARHLVMDFHKRMTTSVQRPPEE